MMIEDGWSAYQAHSWVATARSWLMRGYHHTETKDNARCGALAYDLAMRMLAGVSYPEQVWQ
jgi:hypothetical protein